MKTTKNVLIPVLVLGIGNVLMGDDGVGPYAVEELKKTAWPEGTVFEDAGTSVIHYLAEISRCQRLIVIDAVQGGGCPGSIYCLDEATFLPCWGDSHGFSIMDIIALARTLTGYPKTVVIFGIEPANMGFGNKLSPEVAESLSRLQESLRRYLGMLRP